MRSKWKGIFIHTILYKFANTKFKNFGPNWLNQKVNIRSSIYIKKFISRSLFIHNGLCLVHFRTYNYNYIGIKIGQFTYNRLIPKHSLTTVEKSDLASAVLFQHNKIKSKIKRPQWKSLKNIIE